MNKGVEEQIRQAMDAGKFDNLPGAGKPLAMEDNPYENPEWRLANQVLKNAGYTLPWIEKQREIDQSIDNARIALRRVWLWRQESLAKNVVAATVDLEWHRAQRVFQEQIVALNQRIASFNLGVPLERFQRLPLNPDTEIENIKRQISETR